MSDAPSPLAPAFLMAKLLLEIPLEELRAYCAEHPSRMSTCRTCHRTIAETPWCSPDGVFHLCGWIHVNTKSSSCGWMHPYRFAEPEEICEQG